MRIAYYTCFFGADNNDRNCIPEAPMKTDCYYFTNNESTYQKLEGTYWNRIFVNIPVKNDLTLDAMDAKHLKACPYMYKELNNKDYGATCYFDSALQINVAEVQELAKNVFTLSNYSVIMSRHPFLSPTWLPSVYNEYKNAMLQERYAVQQNQMEAYMTEQIESGLLETDCIHYATGFIVRKNNKVSRLMGEVWYSHIKKCGIECQISFFFVQQMLRGHIYDIEPYSCFKRIGPC